MENRDLFYRLVWVLKEAAAGVSAKNFFNKILAFARHLLYNTQVMKAGGGRSENYSLQRLKKRGVGRYDTPG